MIKAKQLEYALDIYHEYATTRDNPINDYPDFKVIWNYNGQLITCNTYRKQGDNPIIKETRNGSDFRTVIPDFSNESANDPFVTIRHEIFNKLLDYIQSYLYLYKNPEHLLNFLIEEVNQLKGCDTENVDKSTLYNVQTVNDNTALKFMMIDENTDLVPVSLISTLKD